MHQKLLLVRFDWLACDNYHIFIVIIILELLVDMLSLLASYNITVKELKQLLSMLKGERGKWVSGLILRA